MKRVVTAASAALMTILVTLSLTTGTVSATPPNIPSAATAASRLATLTVAAESNQSSYDRSLFNHWITISGTCNTRETVLKRDGVGVVVNSSCAATSGSWYSPFDGATWTAAADVDIDHMVPLAEAWRSGAHAWTGAQRQSYANDLGGPELWAVTDNVNQAKGDQDPSTWQPPLSSFRCTYARAWIQVKYYWKLTLQSSEKSALQSMLATC
ncbi:HNH endonuclease family protein [Streptosporangium sp. NBC_01810]|uniref:HNH endonuclease family protein n=1 Tax=Streptosporangium sp. NBC_01810 TaxID=2975951 RepID=UPI002DDB1753|nr:HNH endonuclease family protein [Streptosporangium sp. NBC_01810]WSA27511.1 HNH endonuclease family protein [Streptosporangium sp. NBC_01810]